MTKQYLRNTALVAAVATLPVPGIAGDGPAVSGYPAPTAVTPTGSSQQEGAPAMLSGAGSGALIGGVAGGPPGAVVGLVLGGSVASTAQRREAEADNRWRKAELKAKNKRLRSEVEAMRGTLRAREAKLASLERQTERAISSGLAVDVLFDTDSASLTGQGQKRLASLAGILKAQQDMAVTLVGQADRRGPEDYNQRLSQRRANAVRDALVAAGVPPDRLRLQAVGEAQADAGMQDPAGLARDRRVTIDLATPQPTDSSEPHMAATGSKF